MPLAITRLDRRTIRRQVRGDDGAAAILARGIGNRTLKYARVWAPHRTGKLARDLRMWTNPRGIRGYTVTVGNTRRIRYAIWQHDGTRAHGPVRAQAMKFKPKGSSRSIYRTWVRGIEPNPYLVDALEAASPYPVRILGAR